MIDMSTFLPPVGAYPCRGGCGGTTELPGVCDDCARRIDAEEHNAQLSAAYKSIPVDFGWARAGDSLMFDRVPKFRRDGLDLDTSAKVIQQISRSQMVLIHGKAGTGKTSLACATLRAIIDAGRYGATYDAHRTAKRARFFSARQVATTLRRDEYNVDAPEVAPRALVARATVALIDDVGQECGGSYRANDRSKVLAEILADRYDAGARTIITTFATPAQWSAMYGDGIARRCWDKDRVRVVEL